MYVTPEQIQAAGKANVDAMLSVAAMQFAAIEKLAALNANAVTSTSSASTKLNRVAAAVLLVMACPEYLAQK